MVPSDGRQHPFWVPAAYAESRPVYCPGHSVAFPTSCRRGAPHCCLRHQACAAAETGGPQAGLIPPPNTPTPILRRAAEVLHLRRAAETQGRLGHDLAVLHPLASRRHDHPAAVPQQRAQGAPRRGAFRMQSGSTCLRSREQQRANMRATPNPSSPCCASQDSTETFFRKVRFWGGGGDAPPVFQVDGVSYLHVKVSC